MLILVEAVASILHDSVLFTPAQWEGMSKVFTRKWNKFPGASDLDVDK